MVDHPPCTWTSMSAGTCIYHAYARYPGVPPKRPARIVYARSDRHRRRTLVDLGAAGRTQRAVMKLDRVDGVDSQGLDHAPWPVNFARQVGSAHTGDLPESSPQFDARFENIDTCAGSGPCRTEAGDRGRIRIGSDCTVYSI